MNLYLETTDILLNRTNRQINLCENVGVLRLDFVKINILDNLNKSFFCIIRLKLNKSLLDRIFYIIVCRTVEK